MNQVIILTDSDKIFPMCLTEWIITHTKTTNKNSQEEMCRNGKQLM